MIRKERRNAPRTYSNVPLDVYDPFGRMIIGEARFVNISYTGSMLETRQPLQLHQPIRLQMQTPGRSPIGIAAHVVWKKKRADKFNYGVQFDLILGDVVTIPPAAQYVFQHAQP